jgi:hypothetical protein
MKLTDEEFEKRAERAQEVAQAAYERRPDSRSWGLYIFDEAPGGIGGGESVFLWFSSEAKQLDFIALDLTFYLPGSKSEASLERVLEDVGKIVSRFRKSEIEHETARLALNDALKGLSQIEWWGTRADLFSGDGKFARDVRAGFRQGEEGATPPDGPISKGEVSDFLDHLAEWNA